MLGSATHGRFGGGLGNTFGNGSPLAVALLPSLPGVLSPHAHGLQGGLYGGSSWRASMDMDGAYNPPAAASLPGTPLHTLPCLSLFVRRGLWLHTWLRGRWTVVCLSFAGARAPSGSSGGLGDITDELLMSIEVHLCPRHWTVLRFALALARHQH